MFCWFSWIFAVIEPIFYLVGEDGEAAIDQEECTGEVGGSSPIAASTNHMARCGYMNIYSYGMDSCQITHIP
jgi:hypothetical protein